MTMEIQEAGLLELARELLDLSYQHSENDYHLKAAKTMTQISGLELHKCWEYVLTVSDQIARA